MTTQEILDYLSEIPEDEWTTGRFTKKQDNKVYHCALGFINIKSNNLNTPRLLKFFNKLGLFNKSGIDNSSIETANSKQALWVRANSFLNSKNSPSLVQINDGYNIHYKQPTAKQRVIQLLKDMIAEGY